MTTASAQILESSASDCGIAVADINAQLKIENVSGIIFFCSSHYDLEQLSQAINETFTCQVIGCTTSGEMTSRYLKNSLVALAFSSDSFAVHSVLINDFSTFDLPEAMRISAQVERELIYNHQLNQNHMFGFLLADGLSAQEENLISKLHQSFEKIQIFGGSAGDDLAFKETHVFFEGQFQKNSAVMSVVELKEDYEVFRIQHFTPTDKELITTDVDASKRLVKEINGEPAAIAYANINGLNPDALTTIDFAMYPLMLSMGDEWYIRSISGVGEDQSLKFHCAIDEGLPLSIGSGEHMVENLESNVEELLKPFEGISFTLGFDCILRKLEIENKDYFQQIEPLLSRLNFIGFSSYGEQSNGMHFNQTFTGVIVGKKADA